MAEYIPPQMQAALKTFEASLAEFRTQRLRVEQLEVPETPPVDPEELEQAAQRPDAPEKLKAVARAVDEGRATWDDVVNARSHTAPEVRELLAASGPGIVHGLEQAEHEESETADAARPHAAGPEHEQQPTRRRVRDEDEEDEDFSERDFLSGGW
ncbi:hypothetical protein FHS23_001011 [Prauserella isguenensis]|uniref:Uncharacterized protein n=1 Tax=Prauserella isguenensis TaxID=1470180 RepID=A0A839RX61_9PSEU|nr:hypothetical protein [Prauserella isguenensis]MBB3050016.1 hypothetical protein [Prauserella isguenensis]